MYWYWWVWIAFIIIAIFLPLSYGWGYRGWGPPYPSYYTRRRVDRVGSAAPPPAGEYETRREVSGYGDPVYGRRAPVGAWGVAADLFWLAVLGAVIWAIVAWAY